MIKRISQSLCLLRNMQYFFGRKPRGSNVPTQSKILEPFSINCLHDNPGARYTAKKLGRGPASGKGSSSVYLEKHVEEELRDRDHDREEALMFALKEDRLPCKRDFLNMAGSSRRKILIMQTA